jgi:hypothetical protein
LYHQRLIQAGHFEAYNQWLFGANENSTAFSTWIKNNHQTYASFEKWMQNHPLQMLQTDATPFK